MSIKRLKQLLLSDFEFFYLFLFVITLLSIRFNYFFIIVFLLLIFKLRKHKHFKHYLSISFIFVLLVIIRFNMPIKTTGIFYVKEVEEKYSIVGNYLVYENLDPYSFYYLDGDAEDIDGPKVFGEFNFKNYLLSKNVRESFILTKSHKVFELSLLNKISHLTDEKENKAYLDAILLSKNNIDDDTMEIYRSLGVSHIFSVSGLHITVFSFLLLRVLKKLMTEDKSYRVLFVFLSIFTIICCFKTTVVRAALYFVLSYYFKKKNVDVTSLETLSIVAILSLIMNPFIFLDRGFVLSYFVTFSIIIGYTFTSNIYYLSLSASLSSFLIVSAINKVFIPFSYLYNIFYTMFFSYYFILVALLDFLNLDIFGLFTKSIYFLEEISKVLLKYSFKIDIPMIHIVLIFLIYYFIYEFYLSIEKNEFGLMKLVMKVVLVFIISAKIIIPSITIIDVGDGNSFLINDRNYTTLIDTGGLLYTDITSRRVVSYLKRLNIRKIDNFILTHNHFDHIGGFDTINDNFDVDNYVISEYSAIELKEKLIAKQTRYLEEGEMYNGFYVIGPNSYSKTNENNNSLVLMYDFYGDSVLFPGDCENINNLYNADYFILAHHGSSTSFDESLVMRINPKCAIISAANSTNKSLPADSTIALLNKYHIKTYGTYDDGSIYIVHILKNYVLTNKQYNLIYGYIV